MPTSHKLISASHLKPGDLATSRYNSWLVTLTERDGVDDARDLLRPEIWSHHSKALRPHDLVRVIGPRGEYDLQLVVLAVVGQGVQLASWPITPTSLSPQRAPPAQAATGDLPRIEANASGAFSLVDVDGAQHTTYSSREEADSALATYCEALGIPAPATNTIRPARKRAPALAKAP